MLIRRVKPPQPKVGDFVLYAGKITGIVDTICNVPTKVYYVSEWNGRGAPPTLFVAKRYIAEPSEIKVVEKPARAVIRRRLY